jgi:hypothetical protein
MTAGVTTALLRCSTPLADDLIWNAMDNLRANLFTSLCSLLQAERPHAVQRWILAGHLPSESALEVETEVGRVRSRRDEMRPAERGKEVV